MRTLAALVALIVAAAICLTLLLLYLAEPLQRAGCC